MDIPHNKHFGKISEKCGQSRYLYLHKFPTVQWGTISQPSITGSGRSLSFPISFSQRPTILATIGQSTSSSDAAHLHTTPINVYADNVGAILHIYGNMSQDNYATIDWIAVGY